MNDRKPKEYYEKHQEGLTNVLGEFPCIQSTTDIPNSNDCVLLHYDEWSSGYGYVGFGGPDNGRGYGAQGTIQPVLIRDDTEIMLGEKIAVDRVYNFDSKVYENSFHDGRFLDTEYKPQFDNVRYDASSNELILPLELHVYTYEADCPGDPKSHWVRMGKSGGILEKRIKIES